MGDRDPPVVETGPVQVAEDGMRFGESVDLLNEMERFYYKGGCSFKEIVPHKGAATLLFILGFGVMARDEMLERINKGDFSGDRPENI